MKTTQTKQRPARKPQRTETRYAVTWIHDGRLYTADASREGAAKVALGAILEGCTSVNAVKYKLEIGE